jgi:hypothetical protein
MPDRTINTGWHHTYGWLRRSELDTGGWFCYEDCDGDLYYTDNPAHKIRLRLECRMDEVTGEKYLCFGKSSMKVKQAQTIQSLSDVIKKSGRS